MGIQVLQRGAHNRRHAHERQHEVLICYAGEGWAEVDGARHEVRPETTLLIGRAAWHTVRNTGSGQMRLLWMIAPAGLEDWFRAMATRAAHARRCRRRSSARRMWRRCRRGSGSCVRTRCRDGVAIVQSAGQRADRRRGPAVNENR